MADISNARPLAIFTGYMVTAAALTATSIAVIRNGASKRRHAPSTRRRVAIALFSLLAAVSLATTWYHMFCFFRWSYEQWASGRTLIDPDRLHLGQWLRDTALFKQAWGETLETPPRAWWCLQIFGFCANWSVMLAVQGESPLEQDALNRAVTDVYSREEEAGPSPVALHAPGTDCGNLLCLQHVLPGRPSL